MKKQSGSLGAEGLQVYLLFPLVMVQLTRSPASGDRGALHIAGPEKIQIQNLKHDFYWMHITFKQLYRQKILSRTIVSQRPST